MIHPKIQESSTRCPNWAKTSLLWQDNSQVYFVGTSEGSWLGRQLFQANLDGRQKVKQITKEPGMHGWWWTSTLARLGFRKTWTTEPGPGGCAGSFFRGRDADVFLEAGLEATLLAFGFFARSQCFWLLYTTGFTKIRFFFLCSFELF